MVGQNGNFIILSYAGYYYVDKWKNSGCYQSASEEDINWERDEKNVMPSMYTVIR